MKSEPAEPAWISDSSLDAFRQLADGLADEAVSLMAGEGLPDPQTGALEIDRLACRRLLDAAGAPPAWFDPRRIEQGQRIFIRHSVLSITALLLGGLVESYSNIHIARLLAGTGRIAHGAARRLFETAQMVHDVMLPDGLKPGGEGHACLLRVRLIHAGVRRKVLGSGRWNPAWGQPINQEDMAFTLLTLSHSVVRGLQRLGVRLSADEREAYFHLWRCAGWILGVDERLLPRNEDEARSLHATVAGRHCRPGEGGQALTRSILDAVAWRPPLFLPRAALAELSRLMLGDPLADALALPRSAAWNRLLTCVCPAVTLLGWMQQSWDYLERISLILGWRYAEWNLRYGLRNRPGPHA